MCGIFGVFGDDTLIVDRKSTFEKGKTRGPDDSEYIVLDGAQLGFHRLSINGYGDPSSSQPICVDNCTLICNGEIYNWKWLTLELGLDTSTSSDCEVIIHMYRKFGIASTLQYLDGVFAFVLYDNLNNMTFLARDMFGVRPLFVHRQGGVIRACASELKMMIGIEWLSAAHFAQFEPGTYCILKRDCIIAQCGFSLNCSVRTTMSRSDACCIVVNSLTSAVVKRVDNTDRPIAALLSGGLDSSLIASIVAREIRPLRLKTWSIGMQGSPDLMHAKLVADHIGSDHISLELTKSEFLSCLKEVIYAIESYDITTVRASVGNWLVAKYIRQQSDAKVIFNGDGADECCGGYLYMGYAPDQLTFDSECRRLLKDIHFFDVLRSDRSISAHGLEARTPFLDREFVQAYMSIPCEYRMQTATSQNEKQLLRDSFRYSNLLPETTLNRRKEAFSDGVSDERESWFTILNDHISQICPGVSEAEYYKNVFRDAYPGCDHMIPYKWMPRFVHTDDPSARLIVKQPN